MEPRRDNAATPTSTSEQKKEKGRFQIVKLEERIAPSKGGVPHVGYTKNNYTNKCGCSG
jgi:hypothetical protein